LGQALESIANQTIAKDLFEVLLIKDRVDETAVSQLLQNTHLRFRVLDSPKPGIVAALNFGLANVSTELIARMDEDDLMISNRLELQKNFLEKNHDFAAVGGQLELINSVNKTIGFSNYSLKFTINSDEVFERSPLPHPGSMYRRSAVVEVGGYREFLPEDWDLWVRINERWKIGNLGRTVLKYRVHSDQLSRYEIYASPKGTHLIQASHLARRADLQDYPSDNESAEEWITKVQSDSSFRSALEHFEFNTEKKPPLLLIRLSQKLGLLNLIKIIGFLCKDFFRHLPILYRTLRHKIRI
jgi:glycosyltransferase involved in cell wall biosynthesis